jgi:HD-GYP domain-containing protein (c-di-GMP phosphodiesterase class II)
MEEESKELGIKESDIEQSGKEYKSGMEESGNTELSGKLPDETADITDNNNIQDTEADTNDINIGDNDYPDDVADTNDTNNTSDTDDDDDNTDSDNDTDNDDISASDNTDTGPAINENISFALDCMLTGLSLTNKILYDKIYKTGELAINIFSLLGYDITDELIISSYFANYGLLAIPENILLKQSFLTVQELDDVKKHPLISADLATSIYIKSLKIDNDNYELYADKISKISADISNHHELPTGKGYFKKMVDTSKESYIIGIADKITGYADKTRRLYSVSMPLKLAVEEVMSLFIGATSIFSFDEKNSIEEYLLENL